jgi:isoamylase
VVETAPGRSYPVGATVEAGGVNFCVYAKHATRVELLLFADAADAAPAELIRLDPDVHRTYHWWHVFVRGVGPGQVYGYRAHGPVDPAAGLRFEPAKLLLDPYALAVVNTERYDRARAIAPGDNAAVAMKAVVVDPAAYDWEGDAPIHRRLVEGVTYEMHVGGFTRHPNSGVDPARRGTYAGLIEKIPYLVDLGVESVELLPVQQFDAQAAPNGANYWGYQPVGWFAPHRAYSSSRGPLGPIAEFRQMVKALHRAGIEVILDVVFNHTAEGGADGPWLSLRGLDNPTYYILEPGDPARYVDYTGTGNTVNGNEAITRRMILDCLRHWVQHMHVDGFRFDLASALSRGEDGQPLPKPPILLGIESDPVLARTRVVAEAWDAAGLYQVTTFAGDRWAVWNGKYRDDVRRFLRGEAGVVAELADRVVGSASLFAQRDRDPGRSVNFVTAHDGFTLNDLVSYDGKHNEANGEAGRDGSDDNISWNCGAEGPSDDPAVERVRRRQIRNFLTVLLTSQGRPMLVMGDEARRTQRGNNNAYCQDNELSWFDWASARAHSDVRRFARGLIRYRRRLRLFASPRFWGEEGSPRIAWHGVRLGAPDWSETSRSLAFEISDPTGEHVHVMLNAYWEPLDFELPALPAGARWLRLADSALDPPDDFADPPAPLADNLEHYRLDARSSAILVASTTNPLPSGERAG